MCHIYHSVTVDGISGWQICRQDDGCWWEWMKVWECILVVINCGLSLYCIYSDTGLVGWLAKGSVSKHLARVPVSCRPMQHRLDIALLYLPVWVICLKQLFLITRLRFFTFWRVFILCLMFIINHSFLFRCQFDWSCGSTGYSHLFRMVLCFTGNSFLSWDNINTWGFPWNTQPIPRPFILLLWVCMA